MPELPEVEVSRRGLLPYLEGQIIDEAIIRNGKFRQQIPENLPELLAGCVAITLKRRGKYILIEIVPSIGSPSKGWVILHLGMSGSLRVVPVSDPWRKHDHFILRVNNHSIRLHDPRRFGLVLWHEGDNPERHPLIRVLGQEPLEPLFTGEWLQVRCSSRNTPIKPLLMDSHLLVGVGNIYAAESLFMAGISPLRAASKISLKRYQTLAYAIQKTLQTSIDAGGSTLRDYVHSDGGAGSFQIQCQVYGRAGESCFRCGGFVRQIRQAGRSTFYCVGCQH
jgi:formamidopyrimidine-DNA glycosylase